MAEKLRIINGNGIGWGTKVMAGDVELSGVTRIDFLPILPDTLITAQLTMLVDYTDVLVEEFSGQPMWAELPLASDSEKVMWPQAMCNAFQQTCERQQKVKLGDKVMVTDDFRLSFNNWLADFFGVAYPISGAV